MKSEVSQE